MSEHRGLINANGDKTDVVGLVIPKWFLQMSSGVLALFMATFVPWAIWITYTLIVLQVKMDSVNEVTSTVDVVRSEQIRRTADFTLLESLQESVQELEREQSQLMRRVEELEKR